MTWASTSTYILQEVTTIGTPFKIVGICGSLRSKSYNLGLLKSLAEIVPSSVNFTIADISEIPFFNEDVETPTPPPVIALCDLVRQADGLVFATPEYNMMISGVLKNTIEWLTRRSLATPLAGKSAAIIGASPLALGTLSAQLQMRQLTFAANMHTLNRPLVHIGNARDKFDSDGNLSDETTRRLLTDFMQAYLTPTRPPTLSQIDSSPKVIGSVFAFCRS